MDSNSKVHIGTSGWHYKHWLGPFYPKKMPACDMLLYYFRHFDTVEINNSFYRLPTHEAFENWRECTPRDFCFAVKASRFITHNKKLKDPENAVENFLPRAEVLKDKLGPILFQLPPRFAKNADRLHALLSILPKRHLYAFEFRDPSWMSNDVYDVLHRHNAAFCIYELAGYMSPMEVTADWTYIRLHGPGGKYQGSYERAYLRQWAQRVRYWERTLRAVYLYFDNDQAAYAVRNALELKELVSEGHMIESGPAGKAA